MNVPVRQLMASVHHHAHGGEAGAGVLQSLFEVFTPRRVCMNNEPDVVWLHVISDLMIALAYYSIPIALVYFVRRRRDLEFNWIFQMFAAFILACGTTHLIGVVDIWKPFYRVDGLVKLATGIISIATAIMLWPLIPRAIALPSPTQLRLANLELQKSKDELEIRVEERTLELAQANEELRREIDERRHAEEQLARQAHELQRSNAELQQFASIISHDLRSPLVSISGCVELLSQEGGKDPGESEELTRLIRQSIGRMSELITSLLTYARLGADGLRLTFCDFNRILEQATRMLKAQIAVTEATITSSPLLTICGDETLLTQLLVNLLENSMKYRGQAPPQIHVSCTETPTEWIFSVRDNGIGISPEYFDKIFLMFQRLHPDNSPYPGSGVGLAACKKIVESHGGRIWVESAPGQGATFSFSIPRSLASACPGMS